MPQLFSRVTSPTLLLYLFVFATQAVNGAYSAAGVETPPGYAVLYPLAFLWVVGWWMRDDSRRRGVEWVFDMGLFLYIAWPLILPYYLFKTRGLKAFLSILAFAAVYAAALVSGAALYFILLG